MTKRYEGLDWSPKDQYLLTPPESFEDAVVCAIVLVIALAMAFL